MGIDPSVPHIRERLRPRKPSSMLSSTSMNSIDWLERKEARVWARTQLSQLPPPDFQSTERSLMKQKIQEDELTTRFIDGNSTVKEVYCFILSFLSFNNASGHSWRWSWSGFEGTTRYRPQCDCYPQKYYLIYIPSPYLRQLNSPHKIYYPSPRPADNGVE